MEAELQFALKNSAVRPKKSIPALNIMLERLNKTAPYKTLHRKKSHTKCEMSDFQYCITKSLKTHLPMYSKHTCLCAHCSLKGCIYDNDQKEPCREHEQVSGCRGCCQMKELFRSSSQPLPKAALEVWLEMKARAKI